MVNVLCEHAPNLFALKSHAAAYGPIPFYFFFSFEKWSQKSSLNFVEFFIFVHKFTKATIPHNTSDDFDIDFNKRLQLWNV